MRRVREHALTSAETAAASDSSRMSSRSRGVRWLRRDLLDGNLRDDGRNWHRCRIQSADFVLTARPRSDRFADARRRFGMESENFSRAFERLA